MPVYDFRCETCGEYLEVLVRGAVPSVCGDQCPVGRGDGELTKVMSRPAAVSRPGAIGREGPSDSAVAASGLTKYVREGKGSYRKTAGSGAAWIGDKP